MLQKAFLRFFFHKYKMKNIKMNCKNLIKNLYLNTFEAIHCELLQV